MVPVKKRLAVSAPASRKRPVQFAQESETSLFRPARGQRAEASLAVELRQRNGRQFIDQSIDADALGLRLVTIIDAPPATASSTR
jgi:hypothetical protein